MDDYTSLVATIAVLGVYIVVVVVIAIAYYVVSSLAHMKALKALNYERPWMAWIPLANYYAYADVTANRQESVPIFLGRLNVPAMLYKFWWAIMIVVSFIPEIGSLLVWVLQTIFLGSCYIKMYAALEHDTEQSQQVVGYISGLIPVVAVVKFLAGKYDKKVF